MTTINSLNDVNAHFGVDTDDDGKVISRNYRVMRFTPNGKDELEKDVSKLEMWELMTPEVKQEVERYQHALNKVENMLRSKRAFVSGNPKLLGNRVTKIESLDSGLDYILNERQTELQLVQRGMMASTEEEKTELSEEIAELRLQNKGVLTDITTKDMHACFMEREAEGIDVGVPLTEMPGFNRLFEEQDKELFYRPAAPLQAISRKTKDTSAYPFDIANEMRDQRHVKFCELYAKVLRALSNQDFKELYGMRNEINDVRDSSFQSKLLNTLRPLPEGLSTHQKALLFLYWNVEAEARKRGKTANLTPRERKVRDLFEDSRMLTFAQWKLLLSIHAKALVLAKKGVRFMALPTGQEGMVKAEAQPMTALKDVNKLWNLMRLEYYRQKHTDLQADIIRACMNLDADALILADKMIVELKEEVLGFMEANNIAKGESL